MYCYPILEFNIFLMEHMKTLTVFGIKFRFGYHANYQLSRFITSQKSHVTFRRSIWWDQTSKRWQEFQMFSRYCCSKHIAVRHHNIEDLFALLVFCDDNPKVSTELWCFECCKSEQAVHYDDVIMSAIASQITSLTIVYSIVYSDVDQRKYQSTASLAFVWWIHRGPVNSPHKWPVTRKMFPFDDVIMADTIVFPEI